MEKVEIVGIGTSIPKKSIDFDGQRRYRVTDGETQVSLAVEAATKALENAGMKITDIEAIVSAAAVGSQPLPCMAALIHEQIAKGTDIPALDIGTTCTSFITAFEIISYLIEAGKYKNVLLVSSDLPSCALNPKQKESFELFSDGAAAVVLTKSKNENTGIIYGLQKTWSEGAHSTEVRGGLTGLHGTRYTDAIKAEYYFDMKGRDILTLVAKKIPSMIEQFYRESGLDESKINFIVPHQASKALGMIMRKIGISKEKYIDIVKEYGNMVSASVPFAFCKAVEEGKIKKGDTVVLMGTAAGLTINMLAFKF